VVKEPYSDPSGVDPEEGFLAALASCHMLWFLSVAANKGYAVEHYVDRPSGAMSEVSGKRQALTHVVLRPEVKFSAETPCAGAELESLHHEAHHECFLASVLRYPLRIEVPG
jgi:organic hydroperoxide reductase OsmC/OhrA